MLKVTPETLGREELAWIWTALKADYRPTYPFQASLVTIQSPATTLSALPVLQRQVSAAPGLATGLPTLTAATPPGGQPAAQLGDTVTVSGASLMGSTSVVLTNSRLGISQTLPATASVLRGVVPVQCAESGAAAAAAEPYRPGGGDVLAVRHVHRRRPADSQQQPPDGDLGDDRRRLGTRHPDRTERTWPSPCRACPTCGPDRRYRCSSAASRLRPTHSRRRRDRPSFTFATLQSTGGSAVPVRLRVDGVDSPILNLTSATPSFTGPTVTVT